MRLVDWIVPRLRSFLSFILVDIKHSPRPTTILSNAISSLIHALTFSVDICKLAIITGSREIHKSAERASLHIRLPSGRHVRTPPPDGVPTEIRRTFNQSELCYRPRGSRTPRHHRRLRATTASPPSLRRLAAAAAVRPYWERSFSAGLSPAPARGKPRSANQLSVTTGDQYALLVVLWTPMRQSDARQSLPRERRICVCVCGA